MLSYFISETASFVELNGFSDNRPVLLIFSFNVVSVSITSVGDDDDDVKRF